MHKLKIRQGDWVIVCDGKKALVLENAGDEKISQSEDEGGSRASRPEDARAGNRCAGPRLQLGRNRTQRHGADRLANRRKIDSCGARLPHPLRQTRRQLPLRPGPCHRYSVRANVALAQPGQTSEPPPNSDPDGAAVSVVAGTVADKSKLFDPRRRLRRTYGRGSKRTNGSSTSPARLA